MSAISVMLRITGEAGGGLAALDAISEALGMMGVKSNGAFGQLSSMMKSYQAEAEKTASVLVGAREAEETAAGKVAVAEAKLQSLRDRGVDDVGRIAVAENALTTTRRNHESAVRNVSSAEEDAAAATAKSESAVGKLGSTLGGIPSGYAAVAAGAVIGAGMLLDFGVKSLEAAAGYETLTTRLVTSAGLQKGSLEIVKQGMIDMSSQVGISAEDLAKGMFVVSSGMEHVSDPAKDAANALAILKASAQGAAMEGADLGHVADAVGTALVDYHMDASQAANVTSVLKQAAADGKTNFDQLASSLSSVTPIASAMGIPLNDVLAALAEMTKHGNSAQESTQLLAHTMEELEHPKQGARETLDSLGISASSLADKLSSKGLTGTLNEVAEAITSKMGPDGKVLQNTFVQSQQAAQNLQVAIHGLPGPLQDLANKFVAGDIGAKAFVSGADKMGGESGKLAKEVVNMTDKAEGFTRALQSGSPIAESFNQKLRDAMGDSTTYKTALQLLGFNAADVNTILKDLGKTTADANGDVKGMADVNATATQKFNDLKQSVHEVALEFGNMLLPAAKNLADALQNLIKWVKDHPEAMHALKIAAEGLAIALGAIVVAIGLVLVVIGAFALAVGEVVGAVIWLKDKAQELGDKLHDFLAPKFKDAAKTAEDAWNTAKTTLGTAWDTIKTKASEVGKSVGDAFKTAKDTIGQDLDGIKNTVSQKLGDISHTITNSKLGQDLGHMFDAAGGLINSALDFIGRHASQVWDDMTTAASTAWNGLKGLAGTVWNSIRDSIINPISTLASDLASKWDTVKSTAEGKWDELTSWDGWGKIKDTIKTALDDVVSTISGWGGTLISAFTKPFDDAYNAVKGKVGDWVGLGVDLIEGLIKGVLSAAGRLADAAVRAVTGAFNAAMGWLDSHSPSRRAAKELGAPISQGIAVGIDEHAHLVSLSMTSMLKGGFANSKDLVGSMSLPMGGIGGAGGARLGGNQSASQSVVNVHINGPYYGMGGASQAAQDIRTEMLKLQVRTPLGIR